MIGAGIVVAVAGWAAMNSATVRDRLSQAKSWITERVADMRSGEYEEPVAFTAAETKPIEDSIDAVVSDPMSPDYPDGFGASKESLATNGRSTAATHLAIATRPGRAIGRAFRTHSTRPRDRVAWHREPGRPRT